MSEPTQAQIEAAAKAMVAYEEEWGEKFPEGRPWDWTELATTALTAAAQVGEEDGYLFNQSIRLATIERCAQVVDELAKVDYAEYEEAGNKLAKAAAAIRALKDKP